MSIKKWNTKYLPLRIITFPFKLVFQIVWSVLVGLVISFRWLKNGSQEVYYGDDHTSGLVEILEQNKKIIKHFNL